MGFNYNLPNYLIGILKVCPLFFSYLLCVKDGSYFSGLLVTVCPFVKTLERSGWVEFSNLGGFVSVLKIDYNACEINEVGGYSSIFVQATKVRVFKIS